MDFESTFEPVEYEDDEMYYQPGTPQAYTFVGGAAHVQEERRASVNVVYHRAFVPAQVHRQVLVQPVQVTQPVHHFVQSPFMAASPHGHAPQMSFAQMPPPQQAAATEYMCELPVVQDVANVAYGHYLAGEFVLEECRVWYQLGTFQVRGPTPEAVSACVQAIRARCAEMGYPQEPQVPGDQAETPDLGAVADLYSTLTTDNRQAEAAAEAAAAAQRGEMPDSEDSVISEGDDEVVDGEDGGEEGHEKAAERAERAKQREEAKRVKYVRGLEHKLAAQARKIAALRDREGVAAEREKTYIARIAQMEHQFAQLNTKTHTMANQLWTTTQERDKLRVDVQTVMHDASSLQAIVNDSSNYIQYQAHQINCMNHELMSLRAANQHQHMHIQHQFQQARKQTQEPSFSLANIKADIEAAVKETENLSEDERKSKVKALRVRWHPDKNPILREFATEVTKIINDSVAAMEASKSNKMNTSNGSPQKEPPQQPNSQPSPDKNKENTPTMAGDNFAAPGGEFPPGGKPPFAPQRKYSHEVPLEQRPGGGGEGGGIPFVPVQRTYSQPEGIAFVLPNKKAEVGTPLKGGLGSGSLTPQTSFQKQKAAPAAGDDSDDGEFL